MALDLPSLPLTSAAWIFTVLMGLILVVPLVAAMLRIPAVVGLVLAGMVIGPTTFGLIERDGAIAVLGTVGLLYLMFVAGLELDLDDFADNRAHALGFGALTFFVPMIVGVVAISAMGFELLAAILLASCWASHTLLSYPTFRRLGTIGSRAVATSVGATIITDTAALIVLVVVARAHQGALGLTFWLTLIPSLLVLVFVTMWVLPRVARWFFAGPGQDRSLRFVFVMVALFGSAALAELAGIEAIIGAFLAGLALNREVPNESLLMQRVEFLGSNLLIPIFLLSVGMLIDPALLTDPQTLAIGGGFIAIALGAKFLAALAAGKLIRYDRAEIGTMFALSSAQAAATLAAVIVGLEVGLIDTDTVNAVVMVILVTCIVSSWAATRYGSRLVRPAARQALGDAVVVPVANPESRAPLVRLAALIARRDSGFVVPLTVVAAGVGSEELAVLRAANAEAEAVALSHGAEAAGIVRIDATPAAGILHTLVERSGSLLVLGWRGDARRSDALFGGIIDEVLSTTPIPMLLARPRAAPPTGILLAIEAANTTEAGRAGLELAIETTARLARADGLPVRVISETNEAELVRLVRSRLGETLVHDGRKRSIALRETAGADDLVIVPMVGSASGLRAITTRIARAVPQQPILVPIDPRVARPSTTPRNAGGTVVDDPALTGYPATGDQVPPLVGPARASPVEPL